MPATTLEVALIALLGLLIGSFLNVVVYRLPKMLEQRWLDECAHLEKSPPDRSTPLTWSFRARTACAVAIIYAGMKIFRCSAF